MRRACRRVGRRQGGWGVDQTERREQTIALGGEYKKLRALLEVMMKQRYKSKHLGGEYEKGVERGQHCEQLV